MKNKRKNILFRPNKINVNKVIQCKSLSLYTQETDWTCSLACIRTLLSGVTKNIPTEEELIEKHKMKPGPYYSKDIKSMGMVAKYDVLYGCDNKNINMDNILEYITNGYFIMLECLYNYAHWIVLLGFYPLADNIEKSKLLIYDPYYNEVRLLNADEFINMWIDGNYLENKIEKDFIAIRRKI